MRKMVHAHPYEILKSERIKKKKKKDTWLKIFEEVKHLTARMPRVSHGLSIISSSMLRQMPPLQCRDKDIIREKNISVSGPINRWSPSQFPQLCMLIKQGELWMTQVRWGSFSPLFNCKRKHKPTKTSFFSLQYRSFSWVQKINKS